MLPTSLVLTKIFGLAIFGFILAFVLAPAWTKIMYRYKLGKNIRTSEQTPIFTKLHAGKAGTPTLGGVLIWGTVLLLAITFWFLDRVVDFQFFHTFNFLSRRETLVPLAAMIGAAAVGLLDDVLDIYRMGHNGRGMRFRVKVLLYAVVASIGAWWFYDKLGYDFVHIPFWGDLILGWWFVPFFIFVVVGTSFAVNQTDGLDGLAGGTTLIAFFAYAIIAFMQGRDNLAAFLAVICGGLLAFLWFNIFPAKFFMGDNGSMALGVALAIVAFVTNRVLLLPIIGSIFVLEAVTTLLQIGWRKAFHRKLFLSAPIHHHFQALGWPETQVTQRFWIIAAVSSLTGVIIYFLNRL